MTESTNPDRARVTGTDIRPRLDALLLQLGSRARVIRHADLPGQIETALQFARAVGCQPLRVAKTLLLSARHRHATAAQSAVPLYAAVVLALPDRVDLDAVAAALRGDRPRLTTRGELQRLLGTFPGAVSPFFVGTIPVHVDAKLLSFQTVFVSGGVRGIDIEICPADLVEITQATTGRYSLSLSRREAGSGGA